MRGADGGEAAARRRSGGSGGGGRRRHGRKTPGLGPGVKVRGKTGRARRASGHAPAAPVAVHRRGAPGRSASGDRGAAARTGRAWCCAMRAVPGARRWRGRWRGCAGRAGWRCRWPGDWRLAARGCGARACICAAVGCRPARRAWLPRLTGSAHDARRRRRAAGGRGCGWCSSRRCFPTASHAGARRALGALRWAALARLAAPRRRRRRGAGRDRRPHHPLVAGPMPRDRRDRGAGGTPETEALRVSHSVSQLPCRGSGDGCETVTAPAIVPVRSGCPRPFAVRCSRRRSGGTGRGLRHVAGLSGSMRRIECVSSCWPLRLCWARRSGSRASATPAPCRPNAQNPAPGSITVTLNALVEALVFDGTDSGTTPANASSGNKYATYGIADHTSVCIRRSTACWPTG